MNKNQNKPAKQEFSKVYSKTSSSKQFMSLNHQKNNIPSPNQNNSLKNTLNIPKQSKEKIGETTLLNSKSFPYIQNPNGYIKVEVPNSDLQSKVVNKFFRSPSKTQSSIRIFQSVCKQQCTSVTRIATEEGKEPKFKRKKISKIDGEGSFKIEQRKCNRKQNVNTMSQIEVQNLFKKMNQLQKQNEQLTLKLFWLNKKNYPQKIENLEKSIKELEEKLNMKEIEIRQLQEKNQKHQEQIINLTKKVTELIRENQNCKAFTFNINENSNLNSQANFDLDNSGIGFQMLSTAEYIGSLTDLQDQVHNKNKQIFDLNKLIEQLKIKQHVSDLKHQESLRRNINEWQTKYKRLLNSYKELKAMKASDGLMLKKKDSPKCVEQKEEFFNLSLSTDRSQVLNV